MLTRAEAAALLLLGAAIFAWSGWHPFDRATWWMEVAPILIALPILFATRSRFPLTTLVYRLILIHAIILMIGAHYTYARVPAGFWFQDLFDFARNPYDRLGHLVQGFVPAIIAREVLLRNTPLRPGGWLFTIVCAAAMSISVLYEFAEWSAALLTGEGATEFLGTQGDIWDTQWDMFCATIGAIAAQLMLGPVHDRALARVPVRV